MFIINTSSTWFGHHYAHLQETKSCVTARDELRCFCLICLVAIVGRCVVGWEDCSRYCSTRRVIFTAETCSSRFKVGKISNCYIYNFLLCYWFFSYLTTFFFTASVVKRGIISLLLHFRYHRYFFFSVIIISNIFIVTTTTTTIIIYVHLNKIIVMFAVPSPPCLSLLFLSTTTSISYIIIFISLSFLIMTVFAITFLFFLSLVWFLIHH